MAAFCEAIGLAPHDEMTTWKAEMPDAWKKWPGWHDDAAKSTGFVKAMPRSGPPKVETPLPDIVTRAIEEWQPVYDRLYSQRFVV